ncbi:MAG: hypothetical protein HZA06_05680, partial [Nitrospirae bacterium]|nr:hypothetical protein [Nitrospirota bacterium]
MRFFNIKSIGLITLIVISVVMIAEGCGIGTNKKGTSEVTIFIANNQQTTFKIKKSTRLASLKNYFRRIIEVKEASAAPFVITDIRYTVSGADMTTMTGTVSVSTTTQTIVLDVPQGTQRHFI